MTCSSPPPVPRPAAAATSLEPSLDATRRELFTLSRQLVETGRIDLERYLRLRGGNLARRSVSPPIRRVAYRPQDNH